MRSQLVAALLKSQLPGVPDVTVFVDGQALDPSIRYSDAVLLERLQKIENASLSQLAAIQAVNVKFSEQFPRAIAATIQ